MGTDAIGLILDAVLVFVGVRTIYQSELVLSPERKITGWWARGVGLVILLAVALNHVPGAPYLQIVSMVILLAIFIAALVYLYWKRKKQ